MADTPKAYKLGEADDGNALYASVRGENAVYALSINGDELRVTDKFASNGVSPRDFDNTRS